MDSQRSEVARGTTPHRWGVVKVITLTPSLCFVQREKERVKVERVKIEVGSQHSYQHFPKAPEKRHGDSLFR